MAQDSETNQPADEKDCSASGTSAGASLTCQLAGFFFQFGFWVVGFSVCFSWSFFVGGLVQLLFGLAFAPLACLPLFPPFVELCSFWFRRGLVEQVS